MSDFFGGHGGKRGKRRKSRKRRAADAGSDGCCCLFEAIDGPCYVATAAHGEGSAELDTLRRYRDEVLAPSAPGRAFIVGYYFLGRYPAWLVRRSPAFRRATRRALRPVIRHAVNRVGRR